MNLHQPINQNTTQRTQKLLQHAFAVFEALHRNESVEIKITDRWEPVDLTTAYGWRDVLTTLLYAPANLQVAALQHPSCAEPTRVQHLEKLQHLAVTAADVAGAYIRSGLEFRVCAESSPKELLLLDKLEKLTTFFETDEALDGVWNPEIGPW